MRLPGGGVRPDKGLKLKQGGDATNLISFDPVSGPWSDYLIQIPAGVTQITLSAKAPITIKIVMPKKEEK